MGYKTFHPFIDESYDNETNDLNRLEMISNEVKKFANKNKNEKIEFLNSVKDIVKHNQNLFLNYANTKTKNDCLNIIKSINE